MDRKQQVKLLVDDAPKYGVSSQIMEQAVVPVLELFADRLKHWEYFVIQTLDGDWVLTTLSDRSRPSEQKTIIYAFASLKDAANFHGSSDSKLIATSLPITHLLFQVFSLDRLDSIIFMETPGNLNTGTELRRADLQNLIQDRLRQLSTFPQKTSRDLPPNLA